MSKISFVVAHNFATGLVAKFGDLSQCFDVVAEKCPPVSKPSKPQISTTRKHEQKQKAEQAARVELYRQAVESIGDDELAYEIPLAYRLPAPEFSHPAPYADVSARLQQLGAKVGQHSDSRTNEE